MIPKVYSPIFRNKPVVVTKKSVEAHVIKVNGKHYKPMTNGTHKVVVIGGVTYIPVHKVDKAVAATKKVIAPNQASKVNTFNIGNKTYIPLSVVPKVYAPLFKFKVQPLKPAAPKPITRTIKINGNFYTPITNRTVKPIEVDGVHYVPVHSAPVDAVIRKPIISKVKGKVNTFVVGNQTYIPIHAIPKVFAPIFTNKQVKVTKETIASTVIRVNGKSYAPVTDKAHKAIVVNGHTFIPVKSVQPGSIAKNSTLTTNGAKINTFKIGNNTYIPLVVVPKVYRAVF